jgi:hypothetical protein
MKLEEDDFNIFKTGGVRKTISKVVYFLVMQKRNHKRLST